MDKIILALGVLLVAPPAFAQKVYSLEDIPAVWERPLKYHEVLRIAPVDDALLVYGVELTNGSAWEPNLQGLIKLDPATGEQAWHFKEKYTKTEFTVVSAAPTLVGFFSDQYDHRSIHETRVVGIDPATGAEKWHHLYKLRNHRWSTANGSLHFWNIQRDATLQLHKIDLKSGKAETTAIRSLKGALPITMLAESDKLYLFFRKHIEVVDGKTSTTIPHPEHVLLSMPRAVRLGDELLIAVGESVLRIGSDNTLKGAITGADEAVREAKVAYVTKELGAQGVSFSDLVANRIPRATRKKGGEKLVRFRELRNYVLTEAIVSNLIVDDKYVALETRVGDAYRVAFFDTKKLERRRSFELAAPIHSNLLASSGNLYLTTQTHLVALSLQTGALDSWRLPEGLATSHSAADRLSRDSTGIVVSREMGFASFNLEQRRFVKPMGFNVHRPVSASHFEQRNHITLRHLTGRRRPAPAPLRVQDNRIAQQIQALESKAATTSDGQQRAELRMQQQQLAQLNQTFNRIDAVTSTTTATAALFDAVSADLRVSMAYSTLFKPHAASITSASEQMSARFAGGFYFIPYFDKGWYLLVYDRKSGKSASLEVARYSEHLHINGPVFFPYFFDAKTGTLILKVQDLKSAGFDIDNAETRHWGKGRPTHLPNVKLVAVSLKSLTMDSTRLHEKVVWKAGADQRLIEATKDFNPPLAKQLVAEGIDVNATDEFGMTALHWSVGLDNILITDTLLDNGANGGAVDAKGWSVFNYWNACPSPVVKPQKIRKAVQ